MKSYAVVQILFILVIFACYILYSIFFVDMLYDYQVAIGFSPTGMHFPFCGNLVSLHVCISDVYIVVEYRSGANK